MTNRNPLISPFWLSWWACTLAIGWLLPNHYLPWLAFHFDAWIALALSLASMVVIWRSRRPMAWHWITVLVVVLACIPWLQTTFGLITFTGTAWISTAYLLGLLLALLTGAHWEDSSPGQLGDGLFLAIGIAALLSVGLQLQQWLQLDGLELWKMGGGRERPHANFGQPNQLGTFLLWGLLAAAWGRVRQRINSWTALLMAVYLLFGLALTGSRTAWIGMVLLIAATWLWRSLWSHSRLPWVITGLGLYFAVCVVSMGWLQSLLQLDFVSSPDIFSPTSGKQRLAAWVAFVDAVWMHPWIGYGWNQTALAQMAVVTEHPSLHGVFSYSHNLFLDLILWCGIPLGLLISSFFLWWFWVQLRVVKNAENAVLLLLLLVVGNHAMFELPLHYAYFLLPVGLVMGALSTQLGGRPVYLMGRRATMCIWLAASTLLVLIIRDYTRIEPSYQNLRFERLRIKIAPFDPPEVLLLNQWHDFIEFARAEPKAGLSDVELDRMRSVAGLFPSSLFVHKLATALALNQHPNEARLWLIKMCKVVPDQECHDAQTIWAKQALRHTEIAAIPWPVKAND